MDAFQIRRDLLHGRYPLSDLATGLESSMALRRLFGGPERLSEFLSRVEVEISPRAGYMWINNENGCVVVSRQYLTQAEEILLYLDLVHEMVHIRQLLQGRDVFDRSYSYEERPTELEAYGVTLEEARSLGLSEGFIRDYLMVDWITKEQHERMLRTLGVSLG